MTGFATTTWALAALAVAGLAMLGSVVVQPTCHGSPVDTTRLMLMKHGQRVEIYGIRKGYPANGDLSAVFPEELPRDAWDNTVGYVAPGPDGHLFDLISLGADGQFGGSGNNADIRYSTR